MGFHGADTGYATHNFHAFPAKFPPQLPRAFIKTLARPGDVVLDPMVGSGTTLVEAYLAGCAAVGVDIDPLALLHCRVKTQPLPPDALRRTGDAITAAAALALMEPGALDAAIAQRFGAKSRAFIDYWFLPATQRELMALLLAVEQCAPPAQRDFFHLAFSSIIITKSGGVSLARDLAHTRPHRVIDKQPRSAVEQFARRVQQNIRSLRELPSRRIPAQVIQGDARRLPLRANSVDLIVTSPPYASNAIDYMRAHKFSLVWFGHPIDDLSQLRGEYVGGERLSDAEFLALPPDAQRMVNRLAAADAKKGRVLHKYFSEMKQALAEMYRVLRPDGAAVVVVGTSVMRGVNVETHACLGEIAQKAVGFDLVNIAERELDRNKRMMPARFGKQRGSQIEERMHEEYVIALCKPWDAGYEPRARRHDDIPATLRD